jgi:hypothetical protein
MVYFFFFMGNSNSSQSQETIEPSRSGKYIYTLIGGTGGQQTSEIAHSPLQSIQTWKGGSALVAIELVFQNGHKKSLGIQSGSSDSFTFEKDEWISQNSVWGNGMGTRCGAIQFRTNKGREFFSKMSEYGLRTEYKLDVGSGIVVGIGD